MGIGGLVPSRLNLQILGSRSLSSVGMGAVRGMNVGLSHGTGLYGGSSHGSARATNDVTRFTRVPRRTRTRGYGSVLSISLDPAVRTSRADCEDRSDAYLQHLRCINCIQGSWDCYAVFSYFLRCVERGEGSCNWSLMVRATEHRAR